MDVVDRLAALIEERRTTKPRYLVGIDGPDAAGKTTLTAALARRLAPIVVTASIDDFHRPHVDRHARESLGGESSYRDTFNDGLFRTELAEPFRAGATSVRLGCLDYESDRETHPRADVPERAVLVVDGVFLQRPELADLWDLVIYLDISPELSMERGVPRDVLAGRERDELVVAYEQRYLPGQALYRAECDPQASADILVDNSDTANPRVVRWLTPYK